MNREGFFVSERNSVIKQVLEAFLDSKFAGIIYGEPLTGKTFFIKKILESNYVIYHYIDLQKDNLQKELSDLVVDDYNVLVIDNAQFLSEEDLQKILDIYSKFDNLSLILVGSMQLRDKLFKSNLKHYLKNFNFIFEFKELNFKEFKSFLKHYMSEKGISIIFTKGALKDLYRKSEGKIGKVIYLLYKLKNKKFVYKFRKSFLLLPFSLILIATGYYFYINKQLFYTKKVDIVSTEPKINKKQISKIDDTIYYGYLYDNDNKFCYNFLEIPIDILKTKIEKAKTHKDKNILETKAKNATYYISLGAFKYKKNAERLAKIVKEKYQLQPVVIEFDNKSKLFKVKLMYNDKNTAEETLKMLKKNVMFKNAFLRRV